MPIDITLNVNINPSPTLLDRLTTLEGEVRKMSDALTHLTDEVTAEEAQSAKIETTLAEVLTELRTLKAAGGATPEQLDALSARIGAITQSEAAAVAAVPAEDLPPAPAENPTT